MKASNMAADDATGRLILFLWLLPVLWVLGGERLLSPLLAFALFWRSIPYFSRISRPLFWFFLFLIAYLVSSLQVGEASRFLTFLWDFSLYFAMFILISRITSGVHTIGDAERIVKNIVFMVVVSHALAMTYFIGGGWQFETLLGKVVPGAIKGTQIGRALAIHGVGREAYFSGIYTRLASIFSSSMQYAAVGLIALPATIYFFFRSPWAWKPIYGFFCILSIIGIFFSQGRTAIVLSALVVLAMFLIYPTVRSRLFSKGAMALFLLTLIPLVGALALFFFSDIKAEFDHYFIEQRANSAQERFAVYSLSAEAILEAPLFGHGTQQDVEDLAVPLGSHNWYMAIIFKQGLLGLIPFLIFLSTVYSRAISAFFLMPRKSWERKFAGMIVLTVLTHGVLCLTAEPIVDAIHVYIISFYFGIALAIYKIRSLQRSTEPTQNVQASR